MQIQCSPADAARFWARVQMTDECWLWTSAGRVSHGYGYFKAGGRQYHAHRFAWMLTRGPIPEGAFVCHSCDVRACVRPDHLWLGNQETNMADMVSKGRSASGDRNASRRYPERRPRGERNTKARLTTEQVRAIRVDRRTQSATATDYGISQAHVSRIKLRESWQHVR